MADGTQMAGQPGEGIAPQPNDGGPQPPIAPVAPGTGVPTNDPATSPSAPVNHPTPPPHEPDARDAFATEMADADPANFLSAFLAGEGLGTPEALQAGTPGQPGAPSVGQPAPVQPASGAPAPASGQPVGQPGVDPSLLQRLMQGPQVAPQPPAWMAQAPAAGMPPTPTAFQPQSQPQQQGQAPADPNAMPVLFPQPFELPPQLKAALDHDDPNVRATAIGAAMAAAANTTVQRYDAYIKQHVLPQVANASMGQFQQVQFRQTIDRELYGNFPHLRYASPALIQQATQVIVQDELARNPAAAQGSISPEVWRKIGTLASAGLQQMAGGQPPQFNVPPQQAPVQAPVQQQWAPPPPPVPQWNGQAWFLPGQQQAPVYQPQPPTAYAQPPFIAGQSAAPFGFPSQQVVTPESEMAAFMANGTF